MIAVVQRVTEARVTVGETIVGEIGIGLLAFVSIVREDDAKDVAWMTAKLTSLRIFRDETGIGERRHFDK
ncbi:MAG: D-aminoacyl-tRNA deacylase, partial [Planctomycetota bacterium]|nr:D-aminoacyl-tRNA deacylase [Planctomycetota bacterium]